MWYVGGGLGYHTESSADLFHFSPEAGYSFNPHWTVGLGASLQSWTFDVVTMSADNVRTVKQETNTYWFLNPYVRFTFLNIDKLSFFADATASVDALHGFDLQHIGIRPGISYALNDRFTAVAHIGFIGSYHQTFKAEAGLNNLEFSLYYQFKKKK